MKSTLITIALVVISIVSAFAQEHYDISFQDAGKVTPTLPSFTRQKYAGKVPTNIYRLPMIAAEHQAQRLIDGNELHINDVVLIFTADKQNVKKVLIVDWNGYVCVNEFSDLNRPAYIYTLAMK